ncbi:hypothetical protein BpHYR1_027461 [Brachionus plicatilis]|uniref:Uncharacterized protein n=1 Tax=Brachionus plicatilis TaxID=10195 RepID=A0A3M7Q4N7_BRAPC|nr:hypothetical protein BpHYR1_027461 [Brachionus plicatilis]
MSSANNNLIIAGCTSSATVNREEKMVRFVDHDKDIQHKSLVAEVEKFVEIPNKYKKCSIELKTECGRKANAAKFLLSFFYIKSTAFTKSLIR